MIPPRSPWIAFLFRLLDTVIALLLSLPIMSTLIRRISQRIDRYSESRAPLDTDGARPQSGVYEKEVTEIHTLIVNPPVTLSDLPAFLDAVKNLGGVGLDDRKLLLEILIGCMSKAKDLEISKKMQQAVINLLYKDLPHPPSGYVCLPPTVNLPPNAPVKYAFRSADGSNYNPLFPTMGMAGSPYARSVPSTNNSPKTALPDPGLVFDTLLKRDEFVKHPGGMSALFFAFADLVIHSIFNTDHINPMINNASSYLDLSVLYGSSEAEVNSMRRKDGTGKLWDDVFADSRLLHMPPASCALLVLLNRNHNFVAQRILDIDEDKKYTNPPKFEKEANKIAQDDEIFHRARLVNCGYFMHIILGDYVGAILGLVRDQSDWRLDPLMTMRELNHSFAPVGEGNVVSLEFNLLYRWHATLSNEDTQWFGTQVFEKVFEGKDPSEITPRDFIKAAHAFLVPPDDVKSWEFGGLKRENGRFKDADLAKILQDATSHYAGAFKARGIPETLRVVELMAIEQSRNWGTCSLNEFRKFLGLKPYATFKDWNPDPKIHTAAAALYKDIDNLELHVGLQAEEAKKRGPGAGLCPGYTISRAILADAVCLTRGDRFMTVDFTPYNLTAWGYQDCQYDTQDGSFGGLLTKLLFRTLPDFYPRGSAYAHFPFMQPQDMEAGMLKSNPELAAKYDWSYPKPLPGTVPVYNFADVKRVLEDKASYLSAYDERLFKVVKPTLIKKPASIRSDSIRNGFVRGEKGDAKANAALEESRTRFSSRSAEMSKYIFSNPSLEIPFYFSKKTQALIKAKSFEKIGTKTYFVDIVKDVINLLPIHWIAQEIAGLPLKTDSNPTGIWYEQITYDKFADIAEYVYLNFDTVNDWRLRESSQSNSRESIEIIKGHIDKIDSWLSQNNLGIASNNNHGLLKKLWQAQGKGSTYREFASQLFAAVVPTSTLYSQALAHVVNFYLDDDKKAVREEIIKLAASTDEGASAKVMTYVYEALRLEPPIAGVYRTAAKDDTIGSLGIKAGQNVFAGIVDANLDVAVFGAEASTPDYVRATTKPGIFAFGEHGFLTSAFFDATVPAVLGAIFSLKGLQRGPNESGKFTQFTEDWHGTQRALYASQRGLVTPWPESLIIQFTK
ncbi:heme peroxidase [Flammula alnicola]|nr:heme peroxidase [Flammula alnicola]